MASLVVSDVRSRGKRLDYALLWGFAILVAWIVFLPLYFYQRSSENKKVTRTAAPSLCKYCKQPYADASAAYCPNCGLQLKSSIEIHSNVH